MECVVPAKRCVPRLVRFLRDSREVLHEVRKTIEPLFAVTDTFIVRLLLMYFLVEKFWKLTH
jgi:hypothetical protein